MLHGVGSDGSDLISLAPYWAHATPGALFVSPDAPNPYDMAPSGRQWFSLTNKDPIILLREIQKALPAFVDFVAGQVKNTGVPYSRVVLMGFSQGAMMALYAAPRLPEAIAGVMAYSGALLWQEEGILWHPPLLLVHGQDDDVVPSSAFRYGRSTLEAKGFAVTAHLTPGLGHGIDGAGIENGSLFLETILAK